MGISHEPKEIVSAETTDEIISKLEEITEYLDEQERAQ